MPLICDVIANEFQLKRNELEYICNYFQKKTINKEI